jgi:hypothetical protein
LFCSVSLPALSNLVSNPGYESGTGNDADSWGRTGNNGRENWAQESGSFGFAMWGWNNTGGAWWQTGIPANTNARYYFRIRGNEESDFADTDIRIILELYESGDSTLILATTNVYPSGSNADNVWTNFSHSIGATTNTAYVRPVIAWPDRAALGFGSQAFKWDNAYMYDRTLNYRSGEVTEEFSYDDHNDIDDLDGKDRGGNFTNNWIESNAGSFTISDGSFGNVTGYPTNRGNKVVVTPPAAGSRTARRNFAGYTTGVVYAAYFVNYQFNGAAGDNKYAGMSFMQGSSELAFFGEYAGADQQLGLTIFPGATNIGSSYGLNAGSGNDYLVVAKYDFNTRRMQTRAYYKTDSVPEKEITNWNATATLAPGQITRIDGIRLAAGAGTGTPGDTYFDEVRVATNWLELFGMDAGYPAVTNFMVNQGTNAADGQVTSGVINVSMYIDSGNGIESTNQAAPYIRPNFDLVTSAGTEIAQDQVFSLMIYTNSGRTLIASNASVAAVPAASVTLGVYTARLSAISSNGSKIINLPTMSNGAAMSFIVYDDDSEPPIAARENLAWNPGFETNGSGFQTYGSGVGFASTLGESSNYACYVEGQGDGGVYHDTNATPGTVYSFLVRARKETNFGVINAYFKLEFHTNVTDAASGANEINLNSLLTTNWATYSVLATAPVGVAFVRPVIGVYDVGGTNTSRAYFDNMNLSAVSPLALSIGSTYYTPSDITTNGIFTLTDAAFTNVSSTSPFRIRVGAYDPGSGLSRGSNDAATQMNIDLGSWLTDNVTNYVSSNSSAYASTFAGGATSTWQFFSVDVGSLVFLTNAISVSVKDADSDRTDDRITLTNNLFGYLAVNDDDVEPPQVGTGAETNILFNPSFELGNDAVTISNWNRKVDEYREGQDSSGYRTTLAIPNGTNILKMYGSGSELVQTNIAVVAGAFYHAYGQFYHSSTNDAICQACGADSLGMFFKIIWYDSSQVPVMTNFSGEHNALVPSNSWQYINLYVASPTNAVTATFHIQTSPGTNNAGALYADDLHFTRDARVMTVWIGTNMIQNWSDGGTNAIHTIGDGMFAGVAATNKLRIVIGAYDTNSGLDQASMNLDFENWLTDNTTNFVQTNSSPYAETTNSGATSVWVFINTDLNAVVHKTNRITVSIFDNDNDRANDKAIVTNQQFGYIAITDDDADAPVLSGFASLGSVPAAGGGTTLSAGDVAIIGFNSDNPDTFTVVNLVPLAPGTVVKFTDNGWLASGAFRSGEGSLTWSNDTLLDIVSGTKITFTNFNAANLGVSTGSVVKVGSPSLAAPDQLFAFQDTSSSTTLLFGVNWNGGVWQADATDANTTALPPGLTNGANAAAFSSAGSNVYAMVTNTGTRVQLMLAIANTGNWTRTPVTLPPAGSFTLQQTQITDGHMVNGGWSITGLVQDTGSGINSNNTATGNDIGANYDLWSPSNVMVFTNVLFPTHPVDGGGQAAATSLAATVSAVPVSENALGIWTVRVSVADNDEDRADDRRIVTNSAVLLMDVIDDDSNVALVGSAAFSAPMTVWQGTNYRGSIGGSANTTTNAQYSITDGSLANIGTNNLTTDASLESAGTWGTFGNADIVNWSPDTGNSNGLLVGWVTNGSGGFYQPGLAGVPGVTYRMTARLRKESSFDPTNVYLRLEWYQGDDSSRAGTDGGVINIGSQLTASYQTFTTVATAPTGTVYVRPVVSFDGTNQVDTGGNESAFVDNITLHKVDTRLVFSIYDVNSGLQRASGGTSATNVNIDVGGLFTDLLTNYAAELSSSNTFSSASTSTWNWVSSFAAADIQTLYAANSNRVQVSIKDADFDRGNDQTTVTNALLGYLKVIDDDTSPPVFFSSLRGSNTAMDFLIGPNGAVTSYYQSGTGTAGVFRVTDADLIQVSAANPMRFAFGVIDPESGVGRANGGTDPTNLNYDIGSHGWGQNIFATYSNVLSSADTISMGATSLYYHTTPFTYGGYFVDGAGATRTGELWELIGSSTNRITVSADNMDNDRGHGNDAEEVVDREIGQLVVVDDDSTPPTNWLLYVGSTYTFGASNASSITDGDFLNDAIDFAYIWTDPSGILVTNVGTTSPNFGSLNGNTMPNYDFVTPSGVTQAQDIVHTGIYPKINGATIVTVVEYNVSQIVYTNNELGIWYIAASAQDLDSDWPLVTNSANNNIVSPDRAIRTNLLMAFTVGDDDTGLPTLTSNANGRPLGVWIGDTNYAGSSVTTNAVFTLTDGQLAGVGGVNMMSDPSFEYGFTDYQLFGSGYSNSQLAAEHGTNGISFSGAAGMGCCQGFFQNVPVGAITSYVFSTRVRKQPNFAVASVTGGVEMKLEFYDGSFMDLGSTIYSNFAAEITTNWKTFEVVGTAPVGTVYVRPVILYYHTEPLGGTDRELYVDNWSLRTNGINPLKLVFSAYDTNSGIHRAVGANISTTMFVRVGGEITNDTRHYDAASSTVPSTSPGASNVWAFSSINQGQIKAFIDAGSNAVYASMTDADFDRANDWLGVSNQLFGYLQFSDDDNDDPLVRTNALEVMSGGVIVPVWTNQGSTNVVWRVSDGQFYSAAATNPLAFSFRVSDTSGIRRNVGGSATNMNVSIVNVATNNTSNYTASVSSPDTTDANATSVWQWVTGFSQAEVSNIFGSGSVGLTSVVRATVHDADLDWQGDDRSVANQQFGHIWMYDDDTNAPVVANLLGQNLLSNSSFEVEGWWSGTAQAWDNTNGLILGSTFGNHFRSDFRSHGGGYAASVPGQFGVNIDTFGGWFQGVTNSYGDDVVWKAGVWAFADQVWTGVPELTVEFYQSDNVTRVGAVTNYFAVPTGRWAHVTMLATSPLNTAFARLVIAANTLGTNGSLYYDDASLQVATNVTLPMDVLIGDISYYREGRGTTGAFQVTDADLTGVAATSLLKFVFRVYDPTSGVSRSTSSERLNYDLGGSGSPLLTNIYSTWSSTLSSADTTLSTATSVFAHVGNFTLGGFHSGTNFVETGDVFRLLRDVTNNVTVSAPNGDEDRGVTDTEWFNDVQFGYFVVQDEDTNGPVATLKYIGTNYAGGTIESNSVTDEDLVRGAVDFAYEWVDASGLFITNSSGHQTNDANYGNLAMNWEFVDPSNNAVQYGANTIHPAGNIASPSGNGSLYATAFQQNVSIIVYSNNQIGTWTIQASGQDEDDDRGSLSYNNTTVKWDRGIRADMPMYFSVIDDDENPPTVETTLYSQAVAFNAFAAGNPSGSGTRSNRIFEITDEEMLGFVTNPLRIVFNVWDAYSGVARGSNTSLTNLNITVDGWVTNNVTNFNLSGSSAHTTNAASTSQWTISQQFPLSQINSLIGTTNRVTINVPDADGDRVGDTLWRSNHQVGYINWADDDDSPPTLRPFGATNAALQLYVGGSPNLGFPGTNIWLNLYPSAVTNADQLFLITDGALARVSPSTPLDFNIWVSDVGNGVARDAAGNADSNTSLTIGSAILSNVAGFVASNSATYTASKGSTTSTNLWRFTSITYTQVGALYSAAGGSNRILLHAVNYDLDRGVIDQEHSDTNLGWLVVRDDDSNYPSANNLAINGRHATNIIYDGELSTGFSLRVRFWDTSEGLYTGAAIGAFSPPNFDILNPSNALVQTNRAFDSLVTDTQALLFNGGFETVGTNNVLADGWHGICYEYPVQLRRSNDVFRGGQNALVAHYAGAGGFAEVVHQWVNVTNIAVGETFVFGGWLKISNSIPGDGRALVKYEWFSSAVTDACPGANIGFEIGALYTNTGDDWINIQVAGVKPPNADWVKTICEITFVGAATNVVAFDDMYVGSLSNVLATATGVTVPYSNLFLGDYTFRWSAQDSDNDRTNDTLGYTDATNMGYGPHMFTVQDDQPGGPTGVDLWCNGFDKEWTNGVVRDQQIRNGQWLMSFRLVDPSGVATSGIGDDWAPNYSLLNAAGVTVHQNFGFSSFGASDSETNIVAFKTMPGVLYDDVDTGLYTIVFSAQNLDNDRPGDRGVHTNFSGMGQGDGAYGAGNQFLVVDDDTNGPTVPTNVAIDITYWTNINLFNITFNAATDDYSGIFQYRYDTNVTPSATVSNGELVTGVATSMLAVPSFSNADFEIGSHGEIIPENPTNLHGWQDYSSDNATGQYWAIWQSGTGAMRHVIAAGNNAGSPRYTLIGQQVSIDNTNGYPVLASMSAWFSGNVSRVGNGVTGAAFMKMEFFDASTTLIYTVDNEYGNDHNGNPLFGVNTPAWTNVLMTATNGPANTRFIRFMCGIGQHFTDLPYTGYWDNIAITVQVVGAVGNSYSFEMTNALEGVRTNWLFAVDDDNDRGNDRLKGLNTNYITMLDLTAPARVTNFVGTNGLDESSEVSLTWTPLTNAGHRASDGDPLSPWRTYYVYYTTNATVTTNDPSVSFTNAGYGALNTNTTAAIMITNLEFDTTYRFVIRGQDRAGNLGLASPTVEVTTLSFIVTQGMVNASLNVDVSWLAATGRVYDVLYEDALGYTDSLSNRWYTMAGRVTNSWLTDAGDINRAAPQEMVNTLRFYRVSREGQWATNASPRRASREIYVSKTWQLRRGENWVSLPFLPETNRYRVKDVFGTNLLPRGSTIATSTKISWYGYTLAGTNSAGVATNVVWLSSANRWYYSLPPALSGLPADNWPVPTNEAFNLEIPLSSSTQTFIGVGRLPTNAMTMTIYGADGETNYSVVTWGTPYRVRVAELGLIGASFSGGVNVTRSDEIRILDNSEGRGSLAVPKARIWRNGSTNFFLSPSGSLANDYVIEPGEAIIVVRKRGPSIVWTNRLLYLPPGKNINP